MPTRVAAPRPSRKPIEKWNASGGKSNATRGLKCAAPVDDDRERRHERADPEADREAADRVDAAVEQRDVQDADARRPRTNAPSRVRPGQTYRA